MTKISGPVTFSRYFGIDSAELGKAGLIDPFMNVDTPLFVDPVLLEKSENQTISGDGLNAFRTHFSNLIRLLQISRAANDVAWKGARKLLDLKEPPETGLGYGGSSRSGSSRPAEVREAILRTMKEIVVLGAADPEMISLMGFFEEDVGPDTISDFTCRVILPQLVQITQEFCVQQGIPILADAKSDDFLLPRYVDPGNGKVRGTVLVPSDIVRDLPIANDWSGVYEAASENERIRTRINAYLAGIAEPTVADRKAALRDAAMNTSEDLEYFLGAIKESATCYDKLSDALGYYKLKALLEVDLEQFRVSKQHDLTTGPQALKEVVLETIYMFQHHIEKGNLWEELWDGDKPKKERAAQLIYFAIADSYCKANNIDISPEANMGGGPIDFKFSVGYNARVLVEMKRSSGTVKHGYERQLEIYKDASRTQFGIFVVMDFGGLGQKLEQINTIRNARIATGEPVSDIVVIDAGRKISASKR